MKRLVIVTTLAIAAGIVGFTPNAARAQDGEPERPGTDEPAPDEDRPRRRGGGGFGGGFGGMQQGVERLTEELGLRPDQVEKLQEMGDNIRTEMMEGFRRMREEGGGFDPEAMREQFEGLQDRITKDIKGFLDPEQTEKFDKLIEEQGGLFGGMGRGGFGRGGGEGRGRRERVSPEQRKQRRLDEIKKALILSPEEEQVIMPLVSKVIDAQDQLRRFEGDNRREFTEFLKSGAEAEAIEARLGDFRAARKERKVAVESAQGELLELLTLEQEAKLVAFGILP